METREMVRTHLQDMIILPAVVGSMIEVFNCKTSQVEIMPEMISHNLGEFSITFKPVKHSPPGVRATHSSQFISFSGLHSQ
jgi:ribosomal protein uS19